MNLKRISNGSNDMNSDLSKSIRAMLDRFPPEEHGSLDTVQNVAEVNSALGGIIPQWLFSFLTDYPLVGMEVDATLFEPDEDWDGKVWVEFLGAKNILTEATELYPGNVLLSIGYISIASAPDGDQLIIPVEGCDNPPLFLIDHGCGESEASELFAKGRTQLAPRLSDFLDSLAP